MLLEWDTLLQNSSKGALTKSFFPSVNHRLHLRNKDIDFKLTQILTGHGKFRGYLERFKIIGR